MHGKKSHLFLLGTLCLLCSCIDGTYDLKNKEISLDVEIEGNKITFPLGNMRPILLDSMLSTEDQEMLKEINGVYSIAHNGVISPISVELGEIEFNLPNVSYNEKFNFEEASAQIDELIMPGKHEVIEFNVADVSIEDINDSLPELSERVELNVLDEELIELLGTPSFPSFITYANSVYSIKDEVVDVKFDYLLPKEVKSLHEIQVVNASSSAQGVAENAIFHFNINHPHILNATTRRISFQLKFPKSFDVALYPQAENAEMYKLVDNVLTVTDMPVHGDMTKIEFYFNGFKGIEDDSYYTSAKHDDGTDGRKFVLDDVFSYSFDYYVDGDVTISSDVSLKDFKADIALDADFALYDAIGDTNPIEFNFDDECITFSPKIEGLEQISEVKYVRLDPYASQVRLTIDMPASFAPFELKHGESFNIHLPEFLYLNEQLTSIPDGMEYDAENHTIHILKDEALQNASIVLALDSIAVNQKVVDGCIAMSGSARLTTDGSVYFVTDKASLRKDLPVLQDKKIHFNLEETRFVVEEVVVVSDAITKSFHDVADIRINEPLEEGLGKIFSIDFKEDVNLNLIMDLQGLDDIKQSVDMQVDATLPAFICLETNDPDVEYSDGHLRFNTKYTPGVAFKKNIKVTRLDFTKIEDGYLAPTMMDGKNYLNYVDSVVIDATVSVDQMEVSSDILNKTVEVDFEFAVSPIKVGLVQGIYNGDIGAVRESFDLDLGEQLDFLKEEGNGLTLSDPQVMIALENSFNIPLKVDVAIIGKDDNGEVIETAHIVLNDLAITPANYDESTGLITPDSTKYLFVAHEGKEMQGYNTVVVPELTTLLQKIPSSVSFEIIPSVDTTLVHRVDLYQNMQISGDYRIVVPLMFDELSVCYTDTISGLQMDMEEISEVFDNLGFSIYMDVNNTLPIGLTMELTPVDAYGNMITSLEIDPVSVKAGNGSAVTSSGNYEPLKINAQSVNNANLSEFDGLILSVATKANETLGGAALKPEQGIHIKNIVIELRGDINVDLEELSNDIEE